MGIFSAEYLSDETVDTLAGKRKDILTDISYLPAARGDTVFQLEGTTPARYSLKNIVEKIPYRR